MIPNWLHRIILSIINTMVTWMVVDLLLVKISIFKYCILEIIFLVSLKFYTFTCSKLKLNQ